MQNFWLIVESGNVIAQQCWKNQLLIAEIGATDAFGNRSGRHGGRATSIVHTISG
jgi:hypothetical protein